MGRSREVNRTANRRVRCHLQVSYLKYLWRIGLGLVLSGKMWTQRPPGFNRVAYLTRQVLMLSSVSLVDKRKSRLVINVYLATSQCGIGVH